MGGTILLRSPEGRAKMLKKVVDGFAHHVAASGANEGINRSGRSREGDEASADPLRSHREDWGQVERFDADGFRCQRLSEEPEEKRLEAWWSRTAMYEYVCLQILMLIQSDRSACKSRSIA